MVAILSWPQCVNTRWKFDAIHGVMISIICYKNTTYNMYDKNVIAKYIVD